MAITFSSSTVGRVVVPSAFTSINVRTPVAGVSASGIIALIGEADAGPATSATGEDITQNFFTPDQLASVVSKYGSGNIVDAFRAAVTASNDGNIVGSPTRIYLYKTNASTSATSSILALGRTSFGSLSALYQGLSGNLLSWDTDTATSAVEPTTGNFSYAPAGLSYNLVYRQHGGSAVSYTISALTSPVSLASKTSSLQTSSFLVTGGSDRSAFSTNAGVTLSCVTSSVSNGATFTLVSGTFSATPVAGDVVELPLTSVFVGSLTANAGYWVVTSATNSSTVAQFSAIKLNNASATTTVTAPVNVSTTFSASVTTDLICYQPVKFTDKSGVNRGSFVSLTASTIALVATGSSAVLTLSAGSFSPASSVTRPRVTDSVYIPLGSSLAGTADVNVGFYSISAVTDSALTLSRLTNGAGASVASGAIGATPDTNIIVIRPFIDGQQSLLAITDGGAPLSIGRAFYNLATTTSATWISAVGAPVALTGTDYQVALSVNRSSDGTQESYQNIGGNVSLELGYLGTTCTVNVSATMLTTVVTGGTGSNLSITLSAFPTINDLVSYINQQTGYKAIAATAAEGTRSPIVLDKGAFTAAATGDAAIYPARIKRDAWDFEQAVLGSAVVGFTDVALIGLPEATAQATLLTGGARGGTTAAAFAAAVDAMENIDVNFITPLFSQDSATDIAAGLTDSSSTYTIDGINTYLKSHCTSLSGQVKRRKNRLGVGSFKGTFAQARAEAAALASARYALAFQDVKNVSAQGVLTTYQPWMLAVEAAAMQAVGLYRSITRKYVNISGIVNPSGFNPGNYGQLEQALLAGLLVVEPPNGGGFRFVSDQTTYGKDDNFVFNSLQVMYTGDFMALDLAFSFDNFVVGQAVADVPASVGLSFLKAKMSQYLQNKLISPSDGAPAGYDSAVVTISGPVMSVGVNAYITGALYFVPITLNISKVTQSA